MDLTPITEMEPQLVEVVGGVSIPAPSSQPLPTPLPPTSTKSTSRWRTEGHEPPHKALPLPKVESTASSPPNWEEQLEDAQMSLSAYKTFLVDSASQEFHNIVELMAPFMVESVEHIVNPILWERYTTTRKEMLRLKTDDMTLLSKLGFDEKQVQQRAHISRNFEKVPLLAKSSYSPNEVLLFHCTKNMDTLRQILNQGLDERLCSTRKRQCGKGIYFADDPIKSISYDGTKGTILVFGVLLGDCLAVHDRSKMRSFVREPEKTQMQRRNVTDQFFDSVTAKPKGYNEYVIYNRQQCCPLYVIKYKHYQGPTADEPPIYLTSARQSMPAIAWNAMPNQTPDGSWPFYAALLFERMNAASVVPGPNNNAGNINVPPSPFAIAPTGNNAVASSSKSDLDLAVFNDSSIKRTAAEVALIVGIPNDAKVLSTLLQFKLDADQAVNFLLDSKNESESNLPNHSIGAVGSSTTLGNPIKISQKTSTLTSKQQAENTSQTAEHLSTSQNINPVSSNRDNRVNKVPPIPLIDLCSSDSDDNDDNAAIVDQVDNQSRGAKRVLMEDCFICCNEYAAFSHSPQLWKELKCSHKMCLSCHQKIESSGKTMSGIECISTRCPFCQEITGIFLGNCPMGHMNHSIVNKRCEGYPESSSSIQIEYILMSKNEQLRRVAFLPSTTEGYEVLSLLRVAWERRLIFVIGDSHTTGAENVPVWNIHHKTALRGGVEKHGYPDPGYLARIKEELKAYGIQ